MPGGTDQRILAKLAEIEPAEHARHDRVDAAGGRADQRGPARRRAPQALHSQYPDPAIDSKGRADCQSGQTGYPNRLITDGRYPPEKAGPNFRGGGSHVVVDGNTPGLAGGTYKSRQLGIDNLKDVP